MGWLRAEAREAAHRRSELPAIRGYTCLELTLDEALEAAHRRLDLLGTVLFGPQTTVCQSCVATQKHCGRQPIQSVQCSALHTGYQAVAAPVSLAQLDIVIHSVISYIGPDCPHASFVLNRFALRGIINQTWAGNNLASRLVTYLHTGCVKRSHRPKVALFGRYFPYVSPSTQPPEF